MALLAEPENLQTALLRRRPGGSHLPVEQPGRTRVLSQQRQPAGNMDPGAHAVAMVF